jgi:predicted pyridoxine 5'-phosphate oxidase superfamily flavin-nucleotide-binding protein
MNPEAKYASDIAFTPSVKAIQEQKGSRHAYARMEQRGSWATAITPELAAFIANQTSAFIATANANGQPYIQHRGGPAGFLRVLDTRTIGFADYAGNRQYITLGNLADNPKAHLFLIDFAHRRRIKIWGTARAIEENEALVSRLMPESYEARPERAILFDVHAWDANCPSHILQRIVADDVTASIAERDHRIKELEAKIAALQVQSFDSRP